MYPLTAITQNNIKYRGQKNKERLEKGTHMQPLKLSKIRLLSGLFKFDISMS
jgi:hypothetical protein